MIRSAILVLLSAGLIACTSTENDWQEAAAANTVEAYQEFLDHHAHDAHADEARSRIKSLEDRQAWTQAQNTNTIQSLEQYLKSEPTGTHAQQARERIVSFQRADAWKVAQANGSAAALSAFVQKYPQGPEADQARAQLDGNYEVQLAALRSKKDAERTRKRLEARYGKVLHEVLVSTGPDHLNDVRSQPMSLSAAQSACTTVEKSGQHCELIKAAQR